MGVLKWRPPPLSPGKQIISSPKVTRTVRKTGQGKEAPTRGDGDVSSSYELADGAFQQRRASDSCRFSKRNRNDARTAAQRGRTKETAIFILPGNEAEEPGWKLSLEFEARREGGEWFPDSSLAISCITHCLLRLFPVSLKVLAGVRFSPFALPPPILLQGAF